MAGILAGLGLGALSGLTGGSGSIWGNLGEWLGFNNDFSTAGKERIEAQKNRDFQERTAKIAMDHSSKEAQLKRDFQERMSNTAVQRRMDDLAKAGINPILAGQTGASTPAGAQGSGFASSGSKANQNVQQVQFQAFARTAVATAKAISGARSQEQAFHNALKLLQAFAGTG